MEKLLFYSNKWDDFKKVISYKEKLESEGLEIAFSSDLFPIRKALMLGEYLLVNPSKYYYDLLISDKDLEKSVSFKEFEEMIF